MQANFPHFLNESLYIRGGIGHVGERLKKSYKETVYKKYILFENIGILPYISFWLHSQVPKMILRCH